MKTKIFFLLTIPFFLFTSCDSQQEKKSQGGEKDKADEEWAMLFDGSSLSAWRSFHSDTIRGWIIQDGYLTGLGEGSDLSGDIISKQTFDDFELYFEWRIAPGGNSGVMYNVVEEGYKTTYETGPEYQLIDDEGYPGQLEDWQMTAANYAMHVPESKNLNPAGEWNSSRIIVKGDHVEHWLNGEKVLEFETKSADWNKRKEEGKWKDYPDYGVAESGHIALQDHGSKVWFREIKIKEL